MTIPRDVLRFEAYLYASLLIDALSAGFLSAVPDDATDDARLFVNLLTVLVIAALVYLVWLAAQHRRNWARWTLAGLFGLTALLFVGSMGELELSFRMIADFVSLGLTAIGLYFAFTAEASRWFEAPKS
ncbi:hypothetical protein X566_22005 [Afipia sp. P52-10]|uniref:hypothetical protein n=1 Tax=Afipia sp. P52-10 TaxID=1429916 RepID=UPI0003DF34E6|nr:hypothetical protein [Afipia sp. P52-10]ETR75392.1 hypothetical protein X566_22005 [Afipia sp. P52-10]